MTLKKLTRISIFIDYDNFSISLCDHNKIKETEISVWDNLNDYFLKYYSTYFIKNDFEIVDHAGTYLCVGLSDYLIDREEQNVKKKFQALDRKHGFIVKYGYRTAPHRNKKGIFMLGKEKGVDSEIICLMLMGAFLNHYDSCILLSDDNDYIPVIDRVQDYFGKKVIHAGFRDSKLRNKAYGHIPLELTDNRMQI